MQKNSRSRLTVVGCAAVLVPAALALLLITACRKAQEAAPQEPAPQKETPQIVPATSLPSEQAQATQTSPVPSEQASEDPAPVELPTTVPDENAVSWFDSALPGEVLRDPETEKAIANWVPIEVPEPKITDAEPQVVEFLQNVYESLRSDIRSGAKWGTYGMAAQAHFLYDLAEVCYTQAMELTPKDFRWPYLIGIVRKQTGASLSEVITAFEISRERNGSYAPTHYHLGETWARDGQNVKAKAAYQRAVEIDANLGVAHRGLGQLALAQGAPWEALRHLRRAARLMPNDGGTQTLLAQVYTRLDQTDEADEAAARAADLPKVQEPKDPLLKSVDHMNRTSTAAMLRARRKMRKGEFDRAIPDLKLVVTALPDDAEAHVDLATAYLNVGMLDEAAANLEKAVELRPEFLASYVKLGWVHRVAGDLDKAEDVFRRGVEKSPDDFRLLAGLAMIHTDKGDYDKAVEVAQRAIDTTPQEAELHNILGFALQKRGDRQRALECYEEALRIMPEHPQAKQRLEDLRRTLEEQDENVEPQTSQPQP